jgi:hypothetical protein
MQTVIQVICSGNTSLREAIVKDSRLEQFRFAVARQKSPGRNPGWAKLHSTNPETPGAINLTWDSSARILLARVVTKESNGPSEIVGDFVAYLLGRRRQRIRAINILPD